MVFDGVICKELDDEIGRFTKEDCLDNEVIDYVTDFKDIIVTISAKRDDELGKWLIVGVGFHEDKLFPFSVGSADLMLFSDKELPKELTDVVKAFNDNEMLEEILQEVVEHEPEE